MNAILSFTLSPTLFTLPSRASASDTLLKTELSAALKPSPPSEPSSVSVLLAVSSCTDSGLFILLNGARDVLCTLSAILTRMQ